MTAEYSAMISVSSISLSLSRSISRRIFVKTSCARSQGPASATNEWHTWPNSEGTLRVLVGLVDLVTTQASSRFSCLMTSCLCTMSSRFAGPHKELAQVHHLKRMRHQCIMHHQCIQIDKLKPQEKPIWNNLNRLTTKNSGSGFHEISSSFFMPKHAQTMNCICLLNCVLSSFLTSQNPSCSQAEEKHVVASGRLALLARSSERQAACTARLPSEKKAILTSNASNTPRAWGTSTRIHDAN